MILILFCHYFSRFSLECSISFSHFMCVLPFILMNANKFSCSHWLWFISEWREKQKKKKKKKLKPYTRTYPMASIIFFTCIIIHCEKTKNAMCYFLKYLQIYSFFWVFDFHLVLFCFPLFCLHFVTYKTYVFVCHMEMLIFTFDWIEKSFVHISNIFDDLN